MCAMNEQRVEVDSSTYPFLAHAKPRPGQLEMIQDGILALAKGCLLYTSPSPRDAQLSRMPSSA